MSEITLYDLPSRDSCACWSPNPWKTRLFLNFKGIPYKTQWVEYPDIAPTFKNFGIPPNAEGTEYTIPAVCIGGDKYVMDSIKIADELERLHPSPSLHLDSPVLPKVEELSGQLIRPLIGVIMPKVPKNLLNQESLDYWHDTRSKAFGMPMDQLEKEKGGEDAWENVKPAMKEAGDILKAEGGPFVLGKTVSYADFYIVGILRAYKRVDERVFERALEIEPSFKTIYEASKPWLERDDH